MNFNILARVSRLAVIGAILLGSASCVTIDERLGESLIPTSQKWDVYTPAAADIDVCLELADSLSAYSTTRFTFGAVKDGRLGTSIKSTAFTLVPFVDTLDLNNENIADIKIRQFHFSAVRDTFSTVCDNHAKMIQNIYVSELIKPLDSTVLYTGAFMDAKIKKDYLGLEADQIIPSNRITVGTPVYDGGDSLSFDFSEDFSKRFVEKLKTTRYDSLDLFLKNLPGIYITTDAPISDGGRINMFNVALTTDSYGYLTANYAELKLTFEYKDDTPAKDTSFFFFYGPAEIMQADDSDFPTQMAFNASNHDTAEAGFAEEWNLSSEKKQVYVEGGSGLKPVIKATEIRDMVKKIITDATDGKVDPAKVVINKATFILPYDIEGDFSALEKYPQILSPTVRLRSTNGKYISYAGLTDSSISSENQGDINRSLSTYSPDVSHHVQAILNLDENTSDQELEKYDVWFLIMHEENVIEESTTMQDYYDNLEYQQYYNAMMYDPYGYGYGSYGGYGYGSSYGYSSNYYNYYLMSMYASSYGSSSSETETTIELDRDRYYNAVLNGPGADGRKPQLKITFSAPKVVEE